MTNRARTTLLILIMTGVSAAVGGSAVRLLYNAAFDKQLTLLVNAAQGRARLLETMARHEAQLLGGSRETIAQGSAPSDKLPHRP